MKVSREAVVEILAEASLLSGDDRSSFVAAIITTSTCVLRVPPSCARFVLPTTLSSLPCNALGKSPTRL